MILKRADLLTMMAMSHLKKICFVPIEMTTSKRTLRKKIVQIRSFSGPYLDTFHAMRAFSIKGFYVLTIWVYQANKTQICRANQWTGFYMITASVLKGLKIFNCHGEFIRNECLLHFLPKELLTSSVHKVAPKLRSFKS